jgi:tetratricopeptide (TPR) repeat protein
MLGFAREAIKAKASLPVARALTQWRDRHEALEARELTVLAGLYYTANKYPEALRVYRKAVNELPQGKQRQWTRLAIMTCLLRSGKEKEAELLKSRFEKQYPGSAIVDEARYRFGQHAFEKRRLEEALRRFERLLRSTGSARYRKYCEQYLSRTRHLLMRRREAQGAQ